MASSRVPVQQQQHMGFGQNRSPSNGRDTSRLVGSPASSTLPATGSPQLSSSSKSRSPRRTRDRDDSDVTSGIGAVGASVSRSPKKFSNSPRQPRQQFEESAPNSPGSPGSTSNDPKYKCITCIENFVKWSHCLSHMRDMGHGTALVETPDGRRELQNVCKIGSSSPVKTAPVSTPLSKTVHMTPTEASVKGSWSDHVRNKPISPPVTAPAMRKIPDLLSPVINPYGEQDYSSHYTSSLPTISANVSYEYPDIEPLSLVASVSPRSLQGQVQVEPLSGILQGSRAARDEYAYFVRDRRSISLDEPRRRGLSASSSVSSPGDLLHGEHKKKQLPREHRLSPTSAPQSYKYFCPMCGELFYRWSFCLKHLVHTRHFDGLEKGNLRKAQTLCAIDVRGVRSHLHSGLVQSAMHGNGEIFNQLQNGLDISDISQGLGGHRPSFSDYPTVLTLDTLPDKLAYLINSFLTVDDMFSLFCALAKDPPSFSLESDLHESRVRTWSGNTVTLSEADDEGSLSEVTY